MSNREASRCRRAGDTGADDQCGHGMPKAGTDPRFADGEGTETLVEAVCEDDGLEDLVLFRDVLFFAR